VPCVSPFYKKRPLFPKSDNFFYSTNPQNGQNFSTGCKQSYPPKISPRRFLKKAHLLAFYLIIWYYIFITAQSERAAGKVIQFSTAPNNNTNINIF